jgi:hypothetical protein
MSGLWSLLGESSTRIGLVQPTKGLGRKRAVVVAMLQPQVRHRVVPPSRAARGVEDGQADSDPSTGPNPATRPGCAARIGCTRSVSAPWPGREAPEPSVALLGPILRNVGGDITSPGRWLCEAEAYDEQTSGV